MRRYPPVHDNVQFQCCFLNNHSGGHNAQNHMGKAPQTASFLALRRLLAYRASLSAIFWTRITF